MFVFSKNRSVFELLCSYSNLAKVDTLPSLSSIVGVPALLLRESLINWTWYVFVLILVDSTLKPNCTHFILQLGQKGCTYGILGEFWKGILFSLPIAYLKFTNICDTLKCFLFVVIKLAANFFGILLLPGKVYADVINGVQYCVFCLYFN